MMFGIGLKMSYSFIKMRKKILAIGQQTDQKKNIFSGQSMMFDALLDYLVEQDENVLVVNLTSKHQDIQVGKIYFKRIWEYLSIIFRSIPKFIKQRKGILYITTAQTKGGFLRDFIFINLAKLLRYKILLQQFGSNFQIFYESLSPLFKKMVRMTFNQADYIIVEGEFTKRQFEIIDDFERKVIAVTNGLPERNIVSVVEGKQYDDSRPFNLIFLSYMIESKGYWDVLEAVDILRNKFNLNVSCIFSGIFKPSVDDERYSNIQEAEKEFNSFIDKKQLNNVVTYYKGLMGEQKAQAFLNANVFLLPSYFKFEGQPVSVLEAMAYGAIPIVTKYRMIPEMVTEETGIFVEKKSPLQIAMSIKHLMGNKIIYHTMSQKNIERYKTYFTIEKYCEKIMEIVNYMNPLTNN